MIKIIKGDLIEMTKQGDFQVIGHGCNSFVTMGAGIALQIKKTFPAAYEADKKTMPGDIAKMGKITGAKIKDIVVVNCYTQYYYDSRDGSPLDYVALKSSLQALVDKFGVSNKIGIPMIGYGLAGGQLIPILEIFYEVLNDCDATIVVFDRDPKADNLIDVVNEFLELKDKIKTLKL